MAINDPPGDPTRGTGDEKVTEAAEPGFEAAPNDLANEPKDSNAADPARGGCLKLGWGCLPVVLLVLAGAPLQLLI